MTTDTATTGTARDTDRSFLFVLGSSRQRWVDLNRLPLPDFQDGRHETDDWPPVENEETLRQATWEATDIVLASPLYWYTLSAQTKRYLDYWSGWLTVPGSDFKKRMAGRTLWGVTVMADDNESVAGGLATTLDHTAAYLGMRFGGLLLGNGSRPGQVRQDERALVRAKTFFRREMPLARFPYEDTTSVS
jgi:hypothetical protein